jgi:hypothetical protein
VGLLVCTDAFLPLARYETARRGIADPRLVIVEHPLGGVSPDDVLARADAVRGEVLKSVEPAID